MKIAALAALTLIVAGCASGDGRGFSWRAAAIGALAGFAARPAPAPPPIPTPRPTLTCYPAMIPARPDTPLVCQ